MNAVFADSACFIALLNARDRWPGAALRAQDETPRSLVTSEWILIEVADAFADTDARAKVVRMIEILTARADVEIIPATSVGFAEGLALYADREDKDWSLTGCISMQVMTERGLTDVLTSDRHFEQAGFRALLRELE